MTFSNLKPAPKVAKGQMKCFQCRGSHQIKNGDWHELQNQQVFLCVACARNLQESKKKPFAHVK